MRGVDHKAERFVAGYGTTLQWVLIKNRFLFPCSESTIPFWLSALLYLSSFLSASPSCAASSVTDAGCTNEGTLNSTKVSKRTAGIPYVVSPSLFYFSIAIDAANYSHGHTLSAKNRTSPKDVLSRESGTIV